MADRNSELRRQRDLLREHLAWIEREIAASAEPAASPLPPPIAYSEPAGDLDAEAILAQYRKPAPSVSSDARRGCIAWFAAAMLLLVLVALGAYFAYARLTR